MNVLALVMALGLLSPATAAPAQAATQTQTEQKPPPAPDPTEPPPLPQLPQGKPDFQITQDKPAGTKPAGPQAQPVLPGTRYVLGAQDQVKITVFDEADLTNQYRVDSDGFISFPLVGRVRAAGLTLGEFQDRLKTMLSAGYIKNPQLRVEIDQFKSQSVYVIGEVRTPGKIPMTGPLTLLEALALAGSPTSAASSEVLVAHPRKAITGDDKPPDKTPDEMDADIVHVNLKDLQLGKVGQDIVLQDGDIINVPKAQTFYITGQIRNPGSLVWQPGMTVEQGIALAGGLTDRGSDRGMIAKRLVDGKLKDVPVKLEDKVLPNDTIMIRQRFF